MCAHQHTYNYNILLRTNLMVVLKSRFETWPLQILPAGSSSLSSTIVQMVHGCHHITVLCLETGSVLPFTPFSLQPLQSPPPSHGTHTLPYLADSLPTPTSVDHLIGFHTHKLGHSAHLIPEYHHFCVALRRLQRTVHILDD